MAQCIFINCIPLFLVIVSFSKMGIILLRKLSLQNVRLL